MADPPTVTLAHPHPPTLSVVAVILGLLLFWNISSEPLPQSNMAITYLNSAKSLVDGQGLFEGSGRPGRPYPPLYRLLLAGLYLLGLTWWQAACVINCAALTGGAIAVGALCRALQVRHGWVFLMLYFSFAPNYYLLLHARPDLVFTSCSLGAAAFSAQYVHSTRTRHLLAASLLASMAALARYVGLFSTVPVCALAVLAARHGSWRRRLGHLATYCALTGIPMLIWALRNLALTGYLSGISRLAPQHPYVAERTTFLANLHGTWSSFYIDFFCWPALARRPYIEGKEDLSHPVATLILVGLVAVLALLLTVKNHARLRAAASSLLARGGLQRCALSVTAAHLAAYLAALTLVWTFGNNDPIKTRFVAPCYLFAVLLAALLYSLLWTTQTGRGLRTLLILLLLSFVTFHAAKTSHNWKAGTFSPSERKANPYVPTYSAGAREDGG